MKNNTNNLYLDEYFAYKDFIENCRTKEYKENEQLHIHHIIPKSLGGNNDISNLIKLNIHDHITAHTLFSHAFDKNSYEQFVNLAAVNLLNKSPKTEDEIQTHRELYIGSNNPFFGKKHNEESKAKISENNTLTRKDKTYVELYGENSSSEKEKRRVGVTCYHEKQTPEEKKNRGLKISESLKKLKRTPHNAKKVLFNGVEYNSITEAAIINGISVYHLKKKILVIE